MRLLLVFSSILLLTVQHSLETVAAPTFSVARTSSLSSGNIPLPFEEDVLGNSFDYNFTTHRYTVPVSGYYWLHLSTGVPPSYKSDIRLTSAYEQFDIIRAHKSYTSGADTTSRDRLGFFNAGDELYVCSIYGVYSDFFLQTSFSGFCLDQVMESTTAFAVGRSTPQSTVGVVTFSNVFIDTMNQWDLIDNAFIIKTNGIYVFSFTTGAYPSQAHTVSALVNTINITSIYVADTVHAAEDTISKTFIISLNINDRITLFLNRGSIYSDIRFLIAFAGFQYRPKVAGVSWSVFRTTTATGPLDPVEFQKVLVDSADRWNKTSHRYIVPSTGVYFINLSAGAVSAKGVSLSVKVNEVTKFSLIRSSTNHNGVDTRGRSLIVPLNANDVLRVALLLESSLYSDSLTLVTSFSGFRLH